MFVFFFWHVYIYYTNTFNAPLFNPFSWPHAFDVFSESGVMMALSESMRGCIHSGRQVFNTHMHREAHSFCVPHVHIWFLFIFLQYLDL